MSTKTIVKTLISVLVIGGGVGYFMYQAMQSSWAYYYSVDDFRANTDRAQNHSLRIAGTVKPRSVVRDLEKMNMNFALLGTNSEVPVMYKGSVPDNFSEGREVVVEGHLDTTGIFQAETLITRCESKYKAKVK
ncbi:MAG: cytochrome c maturation protein CcmE [Sedimentisphaerales bacterium]|nr:cytochrome c maturation protein CcmE [Sedimentisphaerales bacterium]